MRLFSDFLLIFLRIFSNSFTNFLQFFATFLSRFLAKMRLSVGGCNTYTNIVRYFSGSFAENPTNLSKNRILRVVVVVGGIKIPYNFPREKNDEKIALVQRI